MLKQTKKQMTFIICSLWLPQSDSPQAATPGKLYTVQFSFSGFHSAFAPFTGSILINSQAVYIIFKTTKKQMTFIICSLWLPQLDSNQRHLD